MPISGVNTGGREGGGREGGGALPLFLQNLFTVFVLAAVAIYHRRDITCELLLFHGEREASFPATNSLLKKFGEEQTYGPRNFPRQGIRGGNTPWIHGRRRRNS